MPRHQIPRIQKKLYLDKVHNLKFDPKEKIGNQ